MSAADIILEKFKTARENSEKPFQGIVVCGPTGSGKTAAAISIANELGGEIVTCDSMQIYRYMDIGTAKATPEERRAAVHHMIDIVNPWETYSSAQYKIDAEKCINSLISEGKVPVIAGGTGLYVNALLDGRDYGLKHDEENNSTNPETVRLVKDAEDLAERGEKSALYKLLLEKDPDAAKITHENNVKRVLRYLVSYYETGKTLKERSDISHTSPPMFNFAVFCILPERETLYEKCDKRVDMMREQGLTEEVKRVYGMCAENIGAENTGSLTSLQGIGYKELIPFVTGAADITENQAYDAVKLATRHYVKRQYTWFKKTPGAVFI